MAKLDFGKGDTAQVAIVTGAARGIGRAWALALAARGARVVVNDNDPNQRLVDDVVAAIESKGGVAVADYHSVVDGAKIVATAMKSFGRVDILINVRVLSGGGPTRVERS
jgi:NAD(P)-dependent dehydrogenase (short-subunit alcohol dehydrogenase family)